MITPLEVPKPWPPPGAAWSAFKADQLVVKAARDFTEGLKAPIMPRPAELAWGAKLAREAARPAWEEVVFGKRPEADPEASRRALQILSTASGLPAPSWQQSQTNISEFLVARSMTQLGQRTPPTLLPLVRNPFGPPPSGPSEVEVEIGISEIKLGLQLIALAAGPEAILAKKLLERLAEYGVEKFLEHFIEARTGGHFPGLKYHLPVAPH